jgi:glycosyltransferase involved in cell wall biosynthesis
LPVVDAVIPARNEEPTVAQVVEACRASVSVREVIVVDDGSIDGTADAAVAAGAKVVRPVPPMGAPGGNGTSGPGGASRRGVAGGSKAHAMQAGVAATDADIILFADGDCLGLEPRHLDAICRPVVEGHCELSVGVFDYGSFWNPLILRSPPLSGERAMPRWVWDAIPEAKLDGYTIELRINQVIAEGMFRTRVRTMDGVCNRTKRQKLGRLAGYRATAHMCADILRLPLSGDVPWRTYWKYRQGLTVE